MLLLNVGMSRAVAAPRAVVQARETLMAGRTPATVRPEAALPRRLQACMQELLTVNERYHELLLASEEQRKQLEAARAELGELRPKAAAADARLMDQQEALLRAQTTADALRESHELLTARCTAAEAERTDLHRVLQGYAQRLLECEKELASVKQRNTEAEALLAAHWDAGYEEGVRQQEAEVKGRLRRAQQQSKQKEAEAFARGKSEHAQQTQARLLREQAERRLLAHRADEARKQQTTLASALDDEREQRGKAAERSTKLEERLRGVRHEKDALAVELEATRAAHNADLDHFEQMESALGLACAEYSALAARHARGPTRSPSRERMNVSAAGVHAHGESPPEAARTRPPRPAALLGDAEMAQGGGSGLS